MIILVKLHHYHYAIISTVIFNINISKMEKIHFLTPKILIQKNESYLLEFDMHNYSNNNQYLKNGFFFKAICMQ